MRSAHSFTQATAVSLCAAAMWLWPALAAAQQRGAPRTAVPSAPPQDSLLRNERKDDPRPAPARHEGEGPFKRLIIRGATVIDGTGGPARGPVDIVIEGNRIADVVGVGYPNVPIDSAKRPKGAAREIDGSGFFV